MFSILSVLMFLSLCNAQDSLSLEQKQIVETIHQLSQTTSKKGAGPNAYAKYLHQDFNRWTLRNSKINSKDQWIEGVREWFDDGWYVSERKQKFIEIRVEDKEAHVRRIVDETYMGPKNESSTSKAALAETWVKQEGNWRLHTVNVYPLPKK